MAIYHCSASVIGRKAGRSICAAAAYRSGTRLTDERTGLTHDFRRKGGVVFSEIIAPAGSPEWATDRERLWNEAEKAEDKSTRRATATTGREWRLALPCELDEDARLSATRAFAKHLVDAYGVVADFSIHDPDAEGDDRNFHAHILITDRRMTDAGFAGKVRELSARNGGEQSTVAIRAAWEQIANSHLEAAGVDSRIDHRSYKTRWIDRDATEHLGPAASAMERKGEATERGDINREIEDRNATRERLKAEFEALGVEMLAEELAQMEQAGQDQEAEAEEARTFDPAHILEGITARRSTFTERELMTTLAKEGANAQQRRELVEAILARPEIVGLSEQEGGKATRYTTEGVLQHEAAGLAAADKLANDHSHGLKRGTITRVAESGQFGSMSAEQYAAFIKATGDEGLTIIAGQAGTGKSYTANAIRTAYEGEGFRVIGLAVTNKVTQDMRRDGFNDTRTIHGTLRDLERGRAGWNEKTVLMIDEAAMLSTAQTVDIFTAAQLAGAKVIAIQDTAQLGSAYSRGGLSGAIEEQHPDLVSYLSDIRRVKDTAQDADGQRRAFNLMHEGQFREALDIFDKAGAIHIHDEQEQARAALSAQYAADLSERPDKRRFAFAHSNAEAATLNAELRAIHKERGDLGADHLLRTKDGPELFATGDRLQFTGNAYHRDAKDAGLANGMVGTIREIDGLRMTVALDGKKGDAPRLVSFTVGEDAQAGEFNAFRHGYAGTIYRGQGSTVDDAYRLHAGQERAAASYVGATRHAESLHVFTSREAIRGNDPWMREQGGLDGLDEAKRGSAERSYARWSEDNPELGKKYDLSNYVAYVQGKWTEEKGRAVDLDHLAQQMSRKEEGRAASQFKRAAPDPARAFDSAAQEAAERRKDTAGAKIPGTTPQQAAGAPKDGQESNTPASGEYRPTAQQQAEAQRLAAKISAKRDAAAALWRQHRRDATAGRAASTTPEGAGWTRADEQTARTNTQQQAENAATIRMYRGIGKNVWQAEPGEAVFFSTDRERAAEFGKLHYVDITADELAKFEQPHKPRILAAAPEARNDWRTADPDILDRLKPLDEPQSEQAAPAEPVSTGTAEQPRSMRPDAVRGRVADALRQKIEQPEAEAATDAEKGKGKGKGGAGGSGLSDFEADLQAAAEKADSQTPTTGPTTGKDLSRGPRRGGPSRGMGRGR